MTSVRVLIKYSPYIIEVTSAVMDRLDFWRKATDGIGRCKLKLLGNWDSQFAADDPIQIRLDDIVVFEGYIDKGLPIAEGNVYNQFYELVGRDYGQDLMDKQVDKTGDWMYEVQSADLIIDDMLSKANSEITFTPSGDHKYGGASAIPQIAYTDQGDEYLLEAFRKIFEQINYDFYVDANKALQIFPVGTYDSGIDLNCVVGAAGNNLLSLTKTEFDSQDLKNYVIARVDKINDGWTDGNAADFTGTTGNTISDDFTNKNSNKGIGSIKSLKAAGADVSIVLTFPKFNYTSLPFDVIGEDVLRLAYRFTGYPALSIPRLRLILEDDAGNKITWRVAHQQGTTDMWFQLEVPIGNKVTDNIVGYNNWMGISHNDTVNQWQYETAAYTTFNWKVVKITFANWTQAAYPTAIWIDSLTIPLPMIAVKQDPTSQGLYGVRRYFAPSKYVRTQLELDTYAASELAKSKDPIYGLHVTALGTAGIIGGAFKWLPGYTLTVNSPADGISNVQYRISEAHCVVSEAGQQGHDFIVEADLVPYASLVSGRRLSGTLTPEVAALRELSEKIRAIEKQEDVSLDYLPPLPADAASKIQVGVFGTLAETLVAWTKLWEAEAANASAEWAITADSAASGGYCRKLPTYCYGKYIDFADGLLGIAGEFYALIRLKLDSLTCTVNMTLTITNKDTSEVLATMTIDKANFPAANKYHHFALRVEIPANKQNIRIRLLATTNAAAIISCDYAAILPASIPLGYTDVTIDPGTQNTSASDATQNSSANDATQNTSCPAAGAGTVGQITSGEGASISCVQGGWTELRSFVVPTGDFEAYFLNILIRRYGDYARIGGYVRVYDQTDSLYYPQTNASVPVAGCGDTSGGYTAAASCFITIPKNVTGHTLKVQFYNETVTQNHSAEAGAWGHSQHIHALVNPAHSTGVTNPAHATGITNPAHGHGVTEPSHEH